MNAQINNIDTVNNKQHDGMSKINLKRCPKQKWEDGCAKANGQEQAISLTRLHTIVEETVTTHASLNNCQLFKHLSEQLNAVGIKTEIVESNIYYNPSIQQLGLTPSLYRRFLVCIVPASHDQVSHIQICIDPYFRDLFVVKNPSVQYKPWIDSLPQSYVGPLDALPDIITSLSKQMADHFNRIGWVLPPWRHAGWIIEQFRLNHPSFVKVCDLRPSNIRLYPTEFWCQPLHGRVIGRQNVLERSLDNTQVQNRQIQSGKYEIHKCNWQDIFQRGVSVGSRVSANTVAMCLCGHLRKVRIQPAGTGESTCKQNYEDSQNNIQNRSITASNTQQIIQNCNLNFEALYTDNYFWGQEIVEDNNERRLVNQNRDVHLDKDTLQNKQIQGFRRCVQGFQKTIKNYLSPKKTAPRRILSSILEILV